MRKKLHLLILYFSFPLMVLSQITPATMVANMGRGINTGNVMSAPIEGNWAPAFTSTYFDDIASVGFKTVRIPADFFGVRTSGDTSGYSKEANTASEYASNPLTFTVSSAYLNRIEEVLTWALDRNLIVILDFHGADLKEEFMDTFDQTFAPSLYTDPTSAKRAADNAKFRAIWTQISNRLKVYSYNLLFEIINEPYFRMSETEMNTLNTDIINIIRGTGSNNADRNIIITGGGANSYSAPQNISSDVLNLDDNLIPTFHYYRPFSFTSSSKQQHTDNDWGTVSDKQTVDSEFGQVQTWAQSNSVPILFGEFGADNEGGYNYSTQTYGAYGGPENASRLEYHRYLAEKAIDLGFAFTAWDAGDKSNKTIYKVTDRTWVSDVRNALLGVDCITSGMIKNADIECNVSNDWSLIVPTGTGAASASMVDETSQVYTAKNALKIEVTVAGSAHSKVLLKNQPYTTDISEKAITFRAFAKASNTAQNFKFRVKVTDNSNTVNYTASDAIFLTTSYNLYTWEYTIPANTKEVEFQIMCGAKAGTYYFDDFDTQFNRTGFTLSVENINVTDNAETVIVYPNPAKNKVFVKSSSQIAGIQLFNLTGLQLNCKLNSQNTIDVSHLNNGFYILNIHFNNGAQKSTKLFINN